MSSRAKIRARSRGFNPERTTINLGRGFSPEFTEAMMAEDWFERYKSRMTSKLLYKSVDLQGMLAGSSNDGPKVLRSIHFRD